MSSTEREIANFLHHHAPFNLIPFPQVQAIVPYLTTQIFPPGYDILRYDGPPSSYLYILRSGSVDVLRPNADGVIEVIDVLDSGDVFGHLSLRSNESPSATVRTRETTHVYRLPFEPFERLRHEQPAFGRLFEASALGHLNQIFRVQETGLDQPYRTVLSDIPFSAPISIPPTTSVVHAVQIMSTHMVDCLIVESQPPGIVTAHDMLHRVLAQGRAVDSPISEIMTAPIITLPKDSLIVEGLMTMQERHIRHLPITDHGHIIGVITNNDVLLHQSYNPTLLPKQLHRARTIADLQRYAESVTKTIGMLIKAGARMSDIGRVVAIAHDALLARLIQDAEAQLGPPPAPYAWMVLGSEGRYEQTLRTDQDNALVYADDAPPDAERYFAQLAERVVENLVTCGFPRCPGDIMATNPMWRQSLRTWKHYFNTWIDSPDEERLMRAAIFFDFRQTYGTLDIEQTLRPIILDARRSHLFLARLSTGALRQSPPLGFFRNLVVEQDGQGRDVIDMKTRGTALIVDLARFFALEAACPDTNTQARLRNSFAHSNLSANGADELIAAFEILSALRLRHQYAMIQRGQAPSNLVQIATLSTPERRDLKTAMRAIDEIQKSVSSIYGTSWMR